MYSKIKCIVLNVFLCLSLNSLGQTKVTTPFTKKVDSLQRFTASRYRNKGEFDSIIVLNINLIKQSKKANYVKGEAIGYFEIANALSSLEKNEESLKYLKLAKNLADKFNNRSFLLRVLDCYGRNYVSLKIYDKALVCFDEALSTYHARKLNNKILLSLIYKNRSSAFDAANQPDSALAGVRKSVQINPTPMGFISLAYQYLFVNYQIDSVEKYVKKADELMARGTSSKYEKVFLLMYYGHIYKAKKQYTEALDFYIQALDTAKQIKRTNEVLQGYKYISDIYQRINQKEKSYDYLAKYTQLKDSVSNAKNKELNVVVNKFLLEQEIFYKRDRDKLRNTIIYITVASLILLLAIYLYFNIKRKARLNLVNEKNKVIKEKEQESLQLKQQLNVAFSEVVTLATENSPYFLARFQEVYPEVCEKLLYINKNLVNTELSLLAMIWLNISSKEIARYTFVQPKTIQVKKYRLRKKLNIPPDADFYTWLKGL